MSRQLRVFLCHASQDKPAVRELYERLNAEDWIDPWLDKVSILPGKNWRTVIEKAVEDSDVALICLSDQAVSKEGFVQREFKYAYDIALEKPEGTIYLIPLRLDDCNVPRGLRSFQYVDYFDDERENAYTDLLRALKERYEQILLHEKELLEQKRIDEETRRELEKEIRQRFIEQALTQQVELEEKKKITAEIRRKKQREFIDGIFKVISLNIRRFSIGGIILLGILGILFTGNYIFNNLPINEVPEITPSTTLRPLTATATSKPITPTATNTSFTPIITLTPTAILGIGLTTVGDDGMLLMYVPAGEFIMGSAIIDDEKPIHQVYLDAYWIDQTEITNEKYTLCVNIGRCNSPRFTDIFLNSSYANHPVVYVVWEDAKTYCEWAGRRLPTEAEWEKAARGISGNIYPWGNNAPASDLLNYNNEIGETNEVGNYPNGASIYGAMDMSGNVWEWVGSLYEPYPYDANDGRESLTNSATRVLRGGSWNNSYDFVRSSLRLRFSPKDTDDFLGFRCAMDADQ